MDESADTLHTQLSGTEAMVTAHSRARPHCDGGPARTVDSLPGRIGRYRQSGIDGRLLREPGLEKRQNWVIEEAIPET